MDPGIRRDDEGVATKVCLHRRRAPTFERDEIARGIARIDDRRHVSLVGTWRSLLRRPGVRRDPAPQMSRIRQPCTYILASRRNGTLYVGVTSDPIQRIWQHKNGFIEGFTRQHRVHRLVWFELHITMEAAITREKALKEWKRAWKLDLIERANPYWRDLYDDLN